MEGLDENPPLVPEQKIPLLPNDDSTAVPVPVPVSLDVEPSTGTWATQKTAAAEPFWVKNPNVLFSWQIFPDNTMTMNEKLNALSRLIILLVLVFFIHTQKSHILFIGAITLAAIAVFYFVNRQQSRELFSQMIDPQVRDSVPGNELKQDIFDTPKVGNPFSNILVTDYEYNVHKKPAPPIGNPSVSNEILEAAKKTVLSLNPTQPDLADKLFKNLGDEWDFEQSLRPFCTQPGTTIPNDQEAFSKFCYGSMISCKEGNAFACARNDPRYMS